MSVRCHLNRFSLAIGALLMVGVQGEVRAQMDAQPIESASEMVNLEHQDRKARLMRLSEMHGTQCTQFSETFITPQQHHLTDYPVDIPVLRVVCSDQVFFDFDKDEIKPEAYRVLNTIADSLRKDVPDVVVFIAGYTDSIGSSEYNLKLGMRRAHSVAALLVSLGIARAQVYTVSFGKEVPIADNSTEEGRAKNRRVEFLFAAHIAAINAALRMSRAPHCEGAAVVADNCVFPVEKAQVPISFKPGPNVTVPQPINPKAIEFTDTRTVIDLREEPVPINPK